MYAIRWNGASAARAWSRAIGASAVLVVGMGAYSPSAIAEGDSEGESTSELNKRLLNPNTSLASLTFRSQYRWYEGDLPGADSQDNATVLFQPVFPIDLGRTAAGDSTKKFFLRPAIPFQVDVPVFEPGKGGFGDDTGLADIGFDAAYGLSWDDGTQFAAGVIGSLPTATGDVPGGNANLGPEVFAGKMMSFGFLGGLLTHSWDISSWSDNDVSNTSFQLFLSFILPNAQAWGTQPIITYDWKGDDATIPLNVFYQKTMKFGNTTTRLQVEFNWFPTQPDLFGPEYFVAFNITPVVNNPFQKYFNN